MKNSQFKMMFIAAVAFTAMQAQAQQAVPAAPSSPSGVRWDLGLSYDLGGDKLATVTVDNNIGGNSNQTVRLGQGATFSVGGAFANDQAGQFETVGSIGFKTAGPRAENGKVTFTAFPFTLMQYYRPSDVRLGLGITYNLSPEYEADLSGGNENVKYDDALGLIAQIGWAPLSQRYSLDLRYTSIKFKANSANFNGVNYNVNNAPKFDGSSLGFNATVRF
jgi:outer membrane protein W